MQGFKYSIELFMEEKYRELEDTFHLNGYGGSISLYGLPIPQHVPKWNDFQTVMHQFEIQLTSQIA